MKKTGQNAPAAFPGCVTAEQRVPRQVVAIQNQTSESIAPGDWLVVAPADDAPQQFRVREKDFAGNFSDTAAVLFEPPEDAPVRQPQNQKPAYAGRNGARALPRSEAVRAALVLLDETQCGRRGYAGIPVREMIDSGLIDSLVSGPAEMQLNKACTLMFSLVHRGWATRHKLGNPKRYHYLPTSTTTFQPGPKR